MLKNVLRHKLFVDFEDQPTSPLTHAIFLTKLGCQKFGQKAGMASDSKLLALRQWYMYVDTTSNRTSGTLLSERSCLASEKWRTVRILSL